VVSEDGDDAMIGPASGLPRDAQGRTVESFEPAMILYRRSMGSVEVVNPSRGSSQGRQRASIWCQLQQGRPRSLTAPPAWVSVKRRCVLQPALVPQQVHAPLNAQGGNVALPHLMVAANLLDHPGAPVGVKA